MFVVTEEGRKIEVQHPEIAEDEFMSGFQNVGLYADGVVLKPIWILQIQKYADYGRTSSIRNGIELELTKEIKYTHKPSEEEILWAMSSNGLTRFDIVTVIKGFELDYVDEDE